MQQKVAFKSVLAGFAVFLMILPAFAALNSFFTHSLDRAGWWKPIQDYIVPFQSRMVAASVKPLGIDSKLTPSSTRSSFYMIKNGSSIPVDLAWNCLGWQSALLLIISLMAGLRGNYTLLSRVKCIIFGLVGTLLVNLLRMALIVLGIYYVNSFAAQILHDYFAAFITLIWLIVFWWFSYTFLLEEKEEKLLPTE